MTTEFILNSSGLILSIIGSLLLTFSLSNYLTAIHGAITIHDMKLDALIKRKDKVLVGDVATLLKTGVVDNRRKTVWGMVILTIGFILQLIPYVLTLIKEIV